MKIAVCLIAGNEAGLIDRALDSAFSVTDTVIVVRAIGGQTPDPTLDVARERGCIVGEYRNSPATASWGFVDDFAAARNMAFTLGADTGADWLMWMDCDDTLPEGMGATIRKACEETAEDWILAEYVLPNHGKAVWRERLFRRGTAAWFHGVHEKCVPVSNDKDKDSLKVRVRRDIKVVHEPLGEKTGSQERNINILRWRYQEAQHLAFYLHYEYYLLGNRDESVRYGLEALRLKDLDGVYRYEVLLNLALLAEKNEHAQDLCQRAIKLCPSRREAHNILAHLQMDAGQADESIKTAEHCLTLDLPKIPEWTHRPDCYDWRSRLTLAWAHRLAGDEDKARHIETEIINEAGGPRISVCHPTRGRPMQAIATRLKWLHAAKNPQAIEYIFGFSEDDFETRSKLHRFHHALSPAGKLDTVGGTRVQNYNAAVRASSGPIILTLQDDLEPTPHWDEAICNALKDHLSRPAALQIGDGYRTDDLLITCCVTRPTLDLFGFDGGIYCPEYQGLYCDNDYTEMVKEAGILVSSDIVFKHEHPFFNKQVSLDDTYQKGNSSEAYKEGLEIFNRRWLK